MLLDLSKEYHIQKALNRLDVLAKKGALVELTEKRTISTQQNRYLHLIIGWFCLHTGYDMDYAKRVIFKGLVNREMFFIETRIIDGKKVTKFHSVTSDEVNISIAIDKFRTYCNDKAGIYIPLPDEEVFKEWVIEVTNKMETNKYYL